MNSIKLYIPLTIISCIVLAVSIRIVPSSNQDNSSLTLSSEFEHVIHHPLNSSLTEKKFKELETYFPDHFSREQTSSKYILLFISGSDQCSNCLNEISDYVSLANETEGLINNYTPLLLYYGVDNQQATRFIRASNISELIGNTAFIETSLLPAFDYDNFTDQYGNQNLLYLLDREQRTIFHGFILPAGRTTAWDSKEITFNDAIDTYTHK